MTMQAKPQQNSTQAQTLARLVRAIRRSDAFTLAFASCNSVVQRRELSKELFARLPDKRCLEIDLNTPIISLLETIRERWDTAKPPDYVCVYGLEHSLRPGHDYSPVLGRLNNDRDLIRRAVPVPLLIWLPEYAIDLVARNAPDFWAWRSGVYPFPTDTKLWYQESERIINEGPDGLLAIPTRNRLAEIDRLEKLIHTSQTLKRQDKRVRHLIANALYRLGVLFASIGNRAAACNVLQQSLAMYIASGNDSGTASTMDELGMLQLIRGNLTEARTFFEQGLNIAQRLYEADPENAQFAYDLAYSCYAMSRATDVEAEVSGWLCQGREILRRLAHEERMPDQAAQEMLEWLEERLEED